MRITEKLVSFVKDWESLHDGDLSTIGLEPKLDASDDPIWTEGYGKAIVVNGKFARLSKYPTLESVLPYSIVRTEEQAIILLRSELEKFADGVNKRLEVCVCQSAFDSLVSHAYNCGYSETMYILINSQVDEGRIKEWYENHYITAGGERLRGLVQRRKDEYRMRIKGIYERTQL